MNRLPEIAGGPIGFRLPLAEATLLRLADVLLADSGPGRAERLEVALASDAALAIWAALLAPEPSDPASPLEEVAAWLAPRLPHILAGSTDVHGSALASSQAAAPRSTVCASVIKGASAAEPEAAGAAERNRQFLALLSAAPEWLAEFGDPPRDRAAVIAALPGWLARMVEQARDSSTDGGERQQPGERVPAAAPWQELLPRLADQAARLSALELDLTRVVEQEKLAALKEFAYGAGHEINNPLANISARAQTLLKDERDPERKQKLAAINSQAFRAHEMISDLMLFAQPPQWRSTRVLIAPLVAELASTWRRQAADQDTTLAVEIIDDALAAWADRAALAVAMKALVANALEALGHGGTIEISVAPARLAVHAAGQQPPDAVSIAVRDDGPGIAPTARARIFDPFFSGREAGRGLGFGLPKCWRIVTALSGRIDVQSVANAGATFTLVLPSSEPRQSSRASGAAPR